ncbi:MAG: hypothetical protein COB98_06865 [Flavobacteriaceae bacterium]|nr:MAG: hypothetical protein COB98_06865 [Flavobacteriaceae bacterium]
MKKYNILIVSSLLFYISIQGQVQVHLNIDHNPTPELYEWADRSNLAIITVTNSSESLVGMDYKIKVDVLLDDQLVFQTNNNVISQKLTLGSQTFLADEIIPYNAINFVRPSFKDKIIQTGLLPPGMYSFCVSLIDLSGKTLSTPAKICQPMFITAYQLPELMFPTNGQVIAPINVSSLFFTWTPVTPAPPVELGVKYIISITEIQPGQSASQAFHINYPLIEEEVIGNTQFYWPLDIEIPDPETSFVWSIKPVTENDNPYKSGPNGFSYLEIFTIGNPAETYTPIVTEEEASAITIEKTATIIPIINQDDIKKMHDNITSLSKSSSTNSLKQENIRYVFLTSAAKKLAYFQKFNQLNKGNISKKEIRNQHLKLQDIAKQLIAFPNTSSLEKNDKKKVLKAMIENLKNLTLIK